MKKSTLTIIAALAAVTGLASCVGRAQTNDQTTNEMRSETITLITPAETDVTLLHSLQARSSVREYTPDGLTLEQLSGVMWAAAGQNRPDGKLTAPSAMGLYPILTYAVIPGGIYLYDAPTHSLKRVVEGDFRELTALQDFAYTAPLNIMYIADLSKYSEVYAHLTETAQLYLCGLDAAGYCQNANLWAAGTGLGAVTRAGAKGDAFLAAISAPETYRFILAQTIGVPVK